MYTYYTGLVGLPLELLENIAGHLPAQRDISRLSRSHSRIHALLTAYLLQYNIQYGESSALVWAARNNHLPMARHLIRQGASPNTKESREPWGTPLFYAMYFGHVKMVKLLLSVKADPELRVNGSTTLAAVICNSYENLARSMIPRTVSMNEAISSSGRTALDLACFHRMEFLTRDLLAAGADINAIGGDNISGGRHPSPLVGLLQGVTNPEASKLEELRINDARLRLIMILLEFGGVPSVTAVTLGAKHADARIRYLFNGHTSQSGHEYRSDFGIDRQDINHRCKLLTGRVCARSVGQKPEMDLYDACFPALSDYIRERPPQGPTNGLWSLSRARELGTKLGLVEEENVNECRESSLAVENVEVESFPALPGQAAGGCNNKGTEDFWQRPERSTFNISTVQSPRRCTQMDMVSVQRDPYPPLTERVQIPNHTSSRQWAGFRKGQNAPDAQKIDQVQGDRDPHTELPIAKPRARKGCKAKWTRVQL